MFTDHPMFGFPLRMLFQAGTAYDAAKRAFDFPHAELPHIPRYVPGRPAQPASPVTPPASKKSQVPVTPKRDAPVAHSHKCAAPGCRKKVSGKATYCGATCRKRAQRARDKKNGVSR